MSQRQISLSDDLRRLRDEGYEVAVIGGYLVLTHVPYVTGARNVRYGTLVSELTLRGDVTTRPSTHVAYFAGEQPCDRHGSPLVKLINSEANLYVGPDIVARFMFSSKPAGTGYYADYYEKMTTYCAILSSQAQAIDPRATARTYRPVPADDGAEVFHYLDTASSRAGIGEIGRRLAVPDVAIVGLGGTGSYILDLVAKTPVQRIHLFDGDQYLQHNAFRSPGAPTLDELRRTPTKVAYLAGRYSAMHRGVVPHPYRLDASNVHELDPMRFVFLAIDEA
ncbi:MAG: ThiF family adenylyltransferase, partial [Catenulispora sp.]|nr:ThiF family adenylyltransferase [Catenulispora sp.]